MWRTQLEASLKPKVEEALEVVATIGQDKLWFTETLMQKKLDRGGLLSPDPDRPKEELVYSVIHEGKKVVAVVLHKLSIRDNVYLKKPIKAGLSAQEMRKHNLHARMVHESKSLATEKRLLKEIEGSQRQEEEDIFALRCQCPQCDADLAYATEHLRRTASGNYTRNCRDYSWWWYIAPDEHTWWLGDQKPFLLRKGDTKDRGEEIREVQRYGVVLLKKVDETPIDANDVSANTSPTLVTGKTWTSLVSKNALDKEIKLINCSEKLGVCGEADGIIEDEITAGTAEEEKWSTSMHSGPHHKTTGMTSSEP